MTTVEQMRSTIASTGSQVRIAGVPWPVYRAKVLAAFEAQAVEDAPAIARQAARMRRSVVRGHRAPLSIGAVLAGALPCG